MEKINIANNVTKLKTRLSMFFHQELAKYLEIKDKNTSTETCFRVLTMVPFEMNVLCYYLFGNIHKQRGQF